VTTHQIYAFRYGGPVSSSRAFVMWQRDWDQTSHRNFYFWGLTGGPRPVVVDTGFSPARAAARGVPRYVPAAEMLARLGIEADKVELVILTHLHADHAGGVGFFPRASFCVQRSEFEFWTKDPLSRRPMFQFFLDADTRDALIGLARDGRLMFLDGDAEVAPGVECLLAPGHSPGLQAVAVETERGLAVLGSDTGHVFENYLEDWPSSLTVDQLALLETFDKLRARAASPDLLFPGHDARLAEEYPVVAEGVTRLV
jgi:glyoxylase-like metal-dependent hydrolase (beta-lactamase superfamily II)